MPEEAATQVEFGAPEMDFGVPSVFLEQKWCGGGGGGGGGRGGSPSKQDTRIEFHGIESLKVEHVSYLG